MSDFNLGRATGEIGLKYTGADDTARARRDVKSLEKGGAQAGETFNRAGTRMALAGTAIAGGLALAINAAANFEQKLSGIQAVSGATGDQMEAIRKKALQLGADTKFSASEAASAMEELAKAGVSIPDIMNGAADATVALAAAGEIALPEAATIAANAMNAFGLSAKEMPKIADLIAGAANASAIDVSEFGQSLQQAGAAANLAGVSFPDLATAIALMGNAGIKGSDAGTSLKTMLLNLNPATKKQTELMKKLGIITKDGSNQFFDAQGKAKGLADIAGVLQDSLKGMTQQQKLSTLETLFGSDAIRAAAVISNNGAKGFENMAKAMGKVKAADVAATRMNNLKGNIEQLKGSLETSAIILGNIFIPVLTSIAKAVTGVLNSFAHLSSGTQQVVAAVSAAAAAFLLIAGVGLKLIGTINAISTALKLAFVTNPVALIIVAIVAAIAALAIAGVLLYKHFQPVRQLFDTIGQAFVRAFQAIQPIIQTAVAGFQNLVRVLQGTAAGGTGFVGFMGKLGAIIRDVVIPAVIAVGQFLLRTFGPIITQVRSIIAGFVTAIIGYFVSIAPQLAAIGHAIAVVWNAIWPPLLAIIRVIFPLIVSFIKGALQLLAIGIRVTLAGIANIFRGVFNIIGGIFKIFISLITGQWGAALSGLLQVARGIWQLIKGVFQTVLGVVIVAIAISALKTIGAVFKAGFSIIRSVVTGSINAVRAVFSGAMNSIGAVARAGTAVVRGAFNALQAIRGIVSGIMNGVLGTIRNILGSAAGVVTGALGRVVSAVAGFGGRMFAAGAEIVGRLIAGLTSRLGGLISIAEKVAGVIAKVIPGSPVEEGPLRVLNRGHAGKQIVQMLIDGIETRSSDLAAAMRKATLGVPETVLGTSAALADSASRTSTGAATIVEASPAFDPAAIAKAVTRGLTGAEFKVDEDGIGRIVAGSLVPAFVMGARA